MGIPIHFSMMGRRGARRQGDGVALLIEQMADRKGDASADHSLPWLILLEPASWQADPSGMALAAKGPRRSSDSRAEGDWLLLRQIVGHTVGRFGPSGIPLNLLPLGWGAVCAKYDPEGVCVLRGVSIRPTRPWRGGVHPSFCAFRH